MLSSKKTKIHGMRSTRWNVNDKITQYKGLVNLYARDRKILDSDINKDRSRLKKEIRKLRKEIDNQRETLDNAILGDRQRLRNTLSDNRNLLLAYQKMHPKNVMEVLYQENFTKRKNLDKVNFELKQRAQKLIDLKLEYAELEDQIKYESREKISEETEAQIITAKVQDALMKNETAIDVKNTYNSILNVLKKDAIYFDAVLRALQIDGYNQGKCIIKITEMGQLATEYLDDKKEEYRMLEDALKISMQEREKNISDIEKKIKNLHDNVKYLIRKESVIIMGEEEKSKQTSSESELVGEIDNIEFTLSKIKTVALVTKITDIFPRIQDQARQRKRLKDLVDKQVKVRDILLNKSQHAEEMYTTLNHTMAETTLSYREDKVRLQKEIKEQYMRKIIAMETMEKRGELFMNVRTSFQHLVEILRNVNDSQLPAKPTKTTGKDFRKLEPKKITIVETRKNFVPPEKCETDAQELLAILKRKYKALKSQVAEVRPTQEEEKADYENFVTKMIEPSIVHVVDLSVKEESLIDDSMFDDPQIPTRLDIKAQSEEICEKNAKTEFDI